MAEDYGAPLALFLRPDVANKFVERQRCTACHQGGGSRACCSWSLSCSAVLSSRTTNIASAALILKADPFCSTGSACRVHRAVQARSADANPVRYSPGTRQVEACSRDKKCDIHRRTSRTSITEGFMARSRRPGRPRKTGARRTTRRKAATRKTAARKTGARKTAARKTIGRKTGARKTAGRKTAARKTAARKTITRKSAARKAGGRQTTVRKTAARKTIGRKSVTRKTAVRKKTAGRKITTPSKARGRKTVARRTPNGRRRRKLENGTPVPPSTEPTPEEFPSEDMQRQEPPSEEL